MNSSPFVTGLLLGATLIMAIGAQNAFVLRQGLRREHVPYIVLFCIVADVLLLSLGVAGLGELLGKAPALTAVLTLGGAALASVSWFSALGFGARLLAPLFARQRAWQVLDIVVGLTMLALATLLVIGGSG